MSAEARMSPAPGLLVAFEGLDQSGKETQARRLVEVLGAGGHDVRALSFPDYTTAIGREIQAALHGDREYGADVMQLLYVANRYERQPELQRWLAGGTTVVCDRYLASSIAYGESQGLDPAWLTDVQRHLAQPDLTILLDIAPATAAARKATGRDRYERDLALLARVRESYARQAAQAGWIRIDGERPRDEIAREIMALVASRLGPR
jgi:dTMP kinase